MDKVLAKLDPAEVQTLLEFMRKAEGSTSATVQGSQQPPRLELLPVDLKLDGPATYLSWSRRVMGALAGRGLDGYLSGEVKEPADSKSDEWKVWRTTHMSLYTWLLNSMTPAIATTVDGIMSVKDIWAKLQRTYAGEGNNMKVFQIEQEIDAVFQGDRTIQEYAIELQRLWADYDHFSPVKLCNDPGCQSSEVTSQRRTMQFLKHLNPAFDQRRAILLSQAKIPAIDEAVAIMMQEETRMKLLSETGLSGIRSALAASNPSQVETRKCFNCGEVGHLSRACPKPPKEREFGRRGQFSGRGRGRGGRREGRGSAIGGNRANLSVSEEDSYQTPSSEELEMLEVWRRMRIASNEDKKVSDDGGVASTKGNIASYAHTDTGTHVHALASIPSLRTSDWIIDSGASRHVTGAQNEFLTYTHMVTPESIQIADGTTQPVIGRGSVKCTESLTLSNVLHAPSFPVNLLSISAIILNLKCTVSFDIPKVIFQEKGTGRQLGTGTWRNGLWYLDKEGMESALASLVGADKGAEAELLLQHQRMGHSSFSVLSILYPLLYEKADKQKLVCDACEFGKHTRSSYVSSGNRSANAFDMIHSDVWGPCSITSVNGYRYFVTFIDCHTRVTWVYLMKSKGEVFTCFSDFHKSVQTQYGAVIKVLRSDNGTEYTNQALRGYLSAHGIHHQTTCPYTPAQNGVAERKNRHLLEVTRCMMISMNVPKNLWGQAVLTAAYLINRMPSKVLEWKTPIEMLKGENKFILPLKVFGCVCFVKDNRPALGKLDPRSVKCIFVGYSDTQKGYVCWSPVERKLFVSMDVTFREHEPYYDASSHIRENSRGGDNNSGGTQVTIGSLQCPVPLIESGKTQLRDDDREENRSEGELRVYRRRKQHGNQGGAECDRGEQANTDVLQSDPLSQPAPTQAHSDDEIDPSDSGDEIPNPSPIVLRRSSRNNAGKAPERYGFPHDIAQFCSYSKLSSNFRAFTVSLDAVSIPKCWQEAKQDPKWKAAMLEELGALDKNGTWELMPLPAGKKAVGCKWVFTVKQTPEGIVDRYKARLVAKGYSQTYGVDYDETFAPVAKMSTVRILVSIAANNGWQLHQLDVKNAFLHGDLQEEVYMEVPPGFNTSQTVRKVCKLKKSLYGLKQSPRAWFDRFRKVMLDMGYQQINADHTVFSQSLNNCITILAVYVDDMIITGNNEEEIANLKSKLAKEFEVKDLGLLRYFLGIEVSNGKEGILLSQRKYVLDLLKESGMLGCRPALYPIDQRRKLGKDAGNSVDKERYQRLVGRLIYLNHTRPDISFAVSVVSRYMHDPRKDHLDAVYQILRYLKGTPGKGLLFRNNGHTSIEAFCDSDWASCIDDRRSTSGYCIFVGGNLVSWKSKKQSVVARSTAEAEYRAMALGVAELLWVKSLLEELRMDWGSHMRLWCDSNSAISIANNPVQHDRTKHIEIDRFFIKEKIDSGMLKLSHVSTEDQIADCLTKALNPIALTTLCNKMGLVDIFHPS